MKELTEMNNCLNDSMIEWKARKEGIKERIQINEWKMKYVKMDLNNVIEWIFERINEQHVKEWMKEGIIKRKNKGMKEWRKEWMNKERNEGR